MNNTEYNKELSEVEIFHQFNIDVRNREILISGEETMSEAWCNEPGVDHILSARLIRNLRILTNQDAKAPILIHMKTCGGDWHEGMAIYDAIKMCPAYVTILNYTHARSMSSIILQSADNRVMMPHSSFMFHHGTYADEGEMITVISNLEWYKGTIQTMCDIYVDCMKQTKHSIWHKTTKTKIHKWLNEQMDSKNDVFLSASEAVYNGFADSIFDGNWDNLKK